MKSNLNVDRNAGHGRINHAAVRIASWATASVLVVAMTGCVVAPPPQPRYVQTVRQPIYAPQPQYGEVAAIDRIRLGRSPSGAGAAIGGVAGAVIGNQFGHGNGRAGATVLGAVGGAVLGNSIEANRAANDGPDAFRITVRLNDGSVRSFDYEQLGEIRLGSRVRVEDSRIFMY